MTVQIDETTYKLGFSWCDEIAYCEIKRDASVLGFGIAACHPNDRFCKETGRKIALARAVSGFDKSTRRLFWRAYFGRKKPQVSQKGN